MVSAARDAGAYAEASDVEIAGVDVVLREVVFPIRHRASREDARAAAAQGLAPGGGERRSAEGGG